MILRTILAAAALGATIPASAQQPLSVGNATGLGGAAVTESRRTDAILWNPALVGIYDGPFSSYSALAVDVDAFPASSWRTRARSLGLAGLPSELRWIGGLRPGGGAAVAAGRVQWLATQHRDVALGLSSHHVSAGDVPAGIAAALGGGSDLPGPTPSDSTMRSSVTVLAAARAVHLGRVPVLGALWVGATAKGWWVHSYARGAFRGDEPAEEVYREVALRDVPGYGLDVGVLAQPVERVRLGASVSNVVAGAFRPRYGPRIRLVSVIPGEDGETDVTETHGPYLATEDDGTEEAGLGRALWESVAYPAVLRAGGTVETDAGSFSAALRSTLRAGGLDPEWGASPYTLAYAGPAALPVRASYAWGAETRAVSLGLRLGPCERRWNVGLVRRTGPWGTTYGASASLAAGSAAGCDVFRS